MTKRIFTLLLALCLLLTSTSVALMEEDTLMAQAAEEIISEELDAPVAEAGDFELGEASNEGLVIEAPEASEEETAEEVPEAVEAETEPEAIEAEAEPEAEPETVEQPAEAAEPVAETAEPVAETAEPVVEAPVVAEEKAIVAAAAPVVQFTLTKNAKTTVNVGTNLQINLAAGITAKSYKSSKKAIATVTAAGLVTPKKAGKTVISVTLNTKKKKVLKLTLTVKDPTIPTSVYLSKGGVKVTGTITVNKGTPITLVPVLNSTIAKTTYKWASSKKKIATISGAGVITPKKEGTTKITVTTVRGKKKASIKVKVIDPFKATAVKLNKSGVVLLPIGSTLQLGATMTPANSTSTLKWSTSNKKIATVSKTGLVTGKKKGKAKITVTTSTKKKASVTVQVIAKAGTAKSLIPEFTLNDADNTLETRETRTYVVSLSPFPSNGNVVWTSAEPSIVQVKRYYKGDDLSYYADLYAVSVGWTNITVKDTVSGLSRTFKVIVKSAAEPGSITFPKGGTYNVAVGSKLDVGYEVWDKGSPSTQNSLNHPYNAATVTLTNPSVATITYDSELYKRNGRCTMDFNLHITGRAKGSTTVTVTLKNGVKNSFTLNVI